MIFLLYSLCYKGARVAEKEKCEQRELPLYCLIHADFYRRWNKHIRFDILARHENKTFFSVCGIYDTYVICGGLR